MPSFSLHSPIISSALQAIPSTLGLHKALAGQHVLVTGGTGFFGLWLLGLFQQLNQQGAGVTVTVLSRNPSRFLDAQPGYRDCAWLHWVSGDVRELQAVPGQPVSLIIHAATETSSAAHGKPLEIFDTIVTGARRVFDLAVRTQARVLLTGSGAQYGALRAGADQGAGIAEGFAGACASNSAGSAYAEGKRAQETLGAIYAQTHGIDVIMARCFAFSGPGLPLDGHFAIGNFVRDALCADQVVIRSCGTAVRSYLHGADLAAWLLALLVSGKAGEAYNVGSDQAISIADLAHRVVARVAPGKQVLIMGRTEGTAPSFYVPDISQARGVGLDVWTTLDQSIDSMAVWAKSMGYGI
ncbi:NAD-dependent epimerase/dehydratase family protein [Pseudomonas sichuanensis]|uniref:NAD-dependent epimerase/dehydratase family protein n=1 Tax=Pseudomonas sichuanensis TaxID=2213015 RepID=UPI00215E9CAE|nr:NAD(P)-dependent oxidoreductase [Pseudomonas sichuanensis]UVL87927.1 NAD(P)-dependent oxidoreductase [Pseudomonas sichuanensis]